MKKSQREKTTITIIGAGPVGCFMAILLAQRGYQVNIYERRESKHVSSQLSYHITFYSRAVNAIKKAKLWDKIKDISLPLDGTVAHPLYTEPLFSELNKATTLYFAVQRSELVNLLIEEAAKYKNISFYFNRKLISINNHDKFLIFQNTITEKYETLSFDVVIGADGINSLVRTHIGLHQPSEMERIQETWGYTHIYFDKNIAKSLQLRDNVMHVWSRKDALLVAFPNDDDSFVGMLVVPLKYDPAYIPLTSKKKIEKFIKTTFPDLQSASDIIVDSIQKNPQGTLASIYTNPWYYKDFVVLIGDAAHATVPFYGQGTTAGFEDCLALISLIDMYGTHWEKIFPLYQEERKKHTDVLTDLSRENFNHFRRHKKADYYAVHNRLESILHAIFPTLWNPPLYMLMVTGTDGFADILKKHKKQRRLALVTGVSFVALLITGLIGIKERILTRSK